MLIKSHAKINLSLTINKKIEKKRLHDIQSHFCLIQEHSHRNKLNL